MGVTVILDVFAHTLPVHDIRLLEYFPLQGGFTINKGNEHENSDRNDMRNEGLEFQIQHAN